MIDPRLFHLDMELTLEVFLGIVLLSLFIERALSLIFESRPFIDSTEDGNTIIKLKNLDSESKEAKKYLSQKKKSGLKEIISFVVSLIVVWLIHFDAITIVFASSEETKIYGYIITALIIAGGSKGSLKLFADGFGALSSYADRLKELKKAGII